MNIFTQSAYYHWEFYLLPTISIIEPENGFCGIMFTIGCKAWGIGIMLNDKEDKEE